MNRAAAFNRKHLAVGLVSASLLAFQIILLQLLATSQWHHFAYFVISVALLGFGAAGTILTLARERLLANREKLLPVLLFCCAVMLTTPLGLAQELFGRFDSFLLFSDPAELVRLVAVATLLLTPFLFGALAIGIVFTAEVSRIGSYYLANLLGSGIGSLLGLAGLVLFLPQMLPLACAAAVLVAVVLLQPGYRLQLATLTAGLLLIALSAQLLPGKPVLSQYKDLSRALDLPGADIIAHQPAVEGEVHIVSSPAMRSAPGVSLNWDRPIPSRPVVFISGNAVGPLPDVADGESPLNATTGALPYALHTPRSVLVLDAGTGNDVDLALENGAEAVTAVEPHGGVTETMLAVASDSFGRLYADTRIDWYSQDSRSWLAGDEASYDLIVMPTVGVFGGNAGLTALHEQPLFTRQALRSAYRHLSPDGVMAVSVWVDYPVRKPLRLLATMVEALEAEGVSLPADHIAAVRSWGTLTFCIKRRPLTESDLDGVRSFAKTWGFDPAVLPDIKASERQAYNRLQDESLLQLLDIVQGKKRIELYREYPFRVRPVSDDRPYFSQFLRWGSVDELLALYGRQSMPFLEVGLLVAGLAAATLILLATVLILLPLLRLPRQGGSLCSTLLYFSGLGIGYMWVEMALLHHFVFYLGQPIYSAALVVGVLLIGSGIGSGLSGRLTTASPARWAGAVTLAIVVYALMLGPLLQATLQMDLVWRVALAVVMLIPLAMLMGTPFPLGLRWLDQMRQVQVPWAWGVNSCLSVVATAVATLLVVEVGFSLLLIFAAVAYLLSAMSLWKAWT